MNEIERQIAWHERVLESLRQPGHLWRPMKPGDLHPGAFVVNKDHKQWVDPYGQPLSLDWYYWIDVCDDWSEDFYYVMSGPMCPLPRREDEINADES